MSQSSLILKHLSHGHGLTPLDALLKFGCFRLGARIFQLRQAGHNIKSQTVKRNGKRMSRYSI